MVGGLYATTVLAGGQRIVSVNACSDAIMVDLAPERIGALTWLAREAGGQTATLASSLPVHYGALEEWIHLQPDGLILLGPPPAAARGWIAREQIAVLQLQLPQSLPDLLANYQQTAAWLGLETRVAQHIKRFEKALAARRAQSLAFHGQAVLLLGHGGWVNGSGSLADDLLSRLNLQNSARQHAQPAWSQPGIEAMLSWRPQLVIRTAPAYPGATRAQAIEAWHDTLFLEQGAQLTSWAAHWSNCSLSDLIDGIAFTPSIGN